MRTWPRNGSGTTVQEVNQLLRQYAQMRKMFKGMGKGGMMQRRAMSHWPSRRTKTSW